MTRGVTSAALSIIALLVVSAASAQRPSAPAVCEEPDTVALDFQDGELTDVINTIAKLTGKNFLYDDRVRGRVTVISPTCVGIAEAYRVFESILQVKGFTTVQGPGGILKILPIRDAKESPIETLPGERAVPNRDLYITRLIPLSFIKADTILNTLRPLVSKDASMVGYAPTNTIILTDSAANVRRLLAIIEQIDVSTYREQIKVIPIEHADAGELAGHLQEIFGTQDRGGARARPAARARRAQTTTTPAAAAADAAIGEAGEPRFITDQRTNSIIVIAPRLTIERVEEVIQLLDYKRRGSGRIHVYRLQNADAEEMSATLATLATGGAPAAVGAAGGATARGQVAQLSEGVRVTADAPTNSLIIQSSSEGYAALQDVIQALDIRRPQVMVEALVMDVEVDASDALGSGFLLNSLMGADDGRRLILGANTGVESSLTDPNVSTAGQFVTAILGKTITVLNPDGTTDQVPVIQGIIEARASDADTNIISAPIILTADNEIAEIVVGDNIPIPTSQLQTPETGGFATSQNIERQDVGTTLRVTPQISEGETVRLEVFQEISAVIPGSSSEIGPSTRKRTVDNTVYVKDGETVMIGGILSETQVESVSKIPWLGNIPILGWAFKSRSGSTAKSNLLILLTPHIVRDPQDLERLTVESREEFRDSAGDTFMRSDEEREARARALAAGIDLPHDRNPVRRKLEAHDRRYPVETIPGLRQEHAQREQERLAEIRREGAESGGAYRVQVSLHEDQEGALQLLDRLMREGYDGTLLSRREQDRVLHLVQLGPYLTEDRARQVAREIGASTGLSTVIIIEP